MPSVPYVFLLFQAKASSVGGHLTRLTKYTNISYVNINIHESPHSKFNLYIILEIYSASQASLKQKEACKETQEIMTLLYPLS